MSHVIRIIGHIPAKKNNWRPIRGRIVPTKAREIEPLILAAMSQWRRPPLGRVAVRATFWLARHAGDLDNKFTTLLDVLTSAGVIVDDSVRHVPSQHSRLADQDRWLGWPLDAVEVRLRELAPTRKKNGRKA